MIRRIFYQSVITFSVHVTCLIMTLNCEFETVGLDRDLIARSTAPGVVLSCVILHVTQLTSPDVTPSAPRDLETDDVVTHVTLPGVLSVPTASVALERIGRIGRRTGDAPPLLHPALRAGDDRCPAVGAPLVDLLDPGSWGGSRSRSRAGVGWGPLGPAGVAVSVRSVISQRTAVASPRASLQ